VFGAPVALAARCAAVALPDDLDVRVSSYMTLPAVEVSGRGFGDLILTEVSEGPDGEPYNKPHGWRRLDNREVPMKNIGDVEVAQIVNAAAWLPSETAEDRAREVVRLAGEAGRRWVPPCEGSPAS